MDEHLDQLIALPPIGSSTDVTGLRDLYDRVKFRTSSLEGFGKRASQPDAATLLAGRSRDYVQTEHGESNVPTQEDESNAQFSTRTNSDQASDILNFLRIQVQSREESRC